MQLHMAYFADWGSSLMSCQDSFCAFIKAESPAGTTTKNAMAQRIRIKCTALPAMGINTPAKIMEASMQPDMP